MLKEHPLSAYRTSRSTFSLIARRACVRNRIPKRLGGHVQTADRLRNIPPYLFVTLRNKIAKARAEGVDVISLGVGDPVDPTPQSVIDELCRQAQVPINHQYP